MCKTWRYRRCIVLAALFWEGIWLEGHVCSLTVLPFAVILTPLWVFWAWTDWDKGWPESPGVLLSAIMPTKACPRQGWTLLLVAGYRLPSFPTFPSDFGHAHHPRWRKKQHVMPASFMFPRLSSACSGVQACLPAACCLLCIAGSRRDAVGPWAGGEGVRGCFSTQICSSTITKLVSARVWIYLA